MREFKVEKDYMLDGLRCVIVGQSLGHRCGYIGLPKDHPVYGAHYDNVEVEVHGGLTYSDSCSDYPVENDGLWWLGFDCAHFGDGKDMSLVKELANPEYYSHIVQMERMFPTGEYETVKTTEYVEQELINLVNQLKV